MPDQAEHLRSLVQTTPTVCAKPQAAGGAPLVVVTGSRAVVGTTTVAVNVGAVLADRGARVLIVDAAGERSNMTEIAGVRSTGEFTLAGKHGIANELLPGPVGTKLLAGRGWESAQSASASRREAATGKELLAALQSLRGDFDVMVIDGGSRVARRLWLRAQLVLLVTTSDDAAVMDAYAAMKRHVAGARDATCQNIRLLVNQAQSERLAADAQGRLTNCCQRFLRQSVAAFPALPRCEDREDASAGWHPRVWEAPNSEFGHAAMWLGWAIADVIELSCATACEQSKHVATTRAHCSRISRRSVSKASSVEG